MEQPESSLPYSQAPATCPYPEPTPSIPQWALLVELISGATSGLRSYCMCVAIGIDYINFCISLTLSQQTSCYLCSLIVAMQYFNQKSLFPQGVVNNMVL